MFNLDKKIIPMVNHLFLFKEGKFDVVDLSLPCLVQYSIKWKVSTIGEVFSLETNWDISSDGQCDDPFCQPVSLACYPLIPILLRQPDLPCLAIFHLAIFSIIQMVSRTA